MIFSLISSVFESFFSRFSLSQYDPAVSSEALELQKKLQLIKTNEQAIRTLREAETHYSQQVRRLAEATSQESTLADRSIQAVQKSTEFLEAVPIEQLALIQLTADCAQNPATLDSLEQTITDLEDSCKRTTALIAHGEEELKKANGLITQISTLVSLLPN